MLDWFERQVERITRRIQFIIACRLHPELRRIEGEDDRMWALWYAGAEPPAWQRWVSLTLTLLIGPALVTLIAFSVAELLALRWRRSWVLIFIGGWLAGFALTAVLVELVRDRGVRCRYFTAMRIFGHDVCLSCGYDMAGHADDPWTTRTCPECGSRVTPLERPRDQVDSVPRRPDRREPIESRS